ncbi:N-acetylmuramoyl-L-alanine amidase, partial [Candidatus Saccharibacteria bacterium]|nr:N-acetylmuramoyl-L-alanine amidase [Candidatus Saccharibacteria bacterium]
NKTENSSSNSSSSSSSTVRTGVGGQKSQLPQGVLDEFAQNDILFYDPAEDDCVEVGSSGNSDGSDVYMIGDSDTVLSESYIKEALPNITINAQSGIWFSSDADGVSGVNRIREMGNQHILVMEVGSNGGVEDEDINKLLAAIEGKDLKVILTTIYYANHYADSQMNSSNEVIRKAVEQHENFSLMDWYEVASSDPAKYMNMDDSIHPSEEGMKKLAELVRESVNNVTNMRVSAPSGGGGSGGNVDYSAVYAAKNANESVFDVEDYSQWSAMWGDGNKEDMKKLLENYGDLAYQLGEAVGAPWIAILVQMKYEDPNSVCGKNNFWGNGCDPSHAYRGGSTIQGENLGEGFSQYGETLSDDWYAPVHGITDPKEYLEKIGPLWVQGDPNGPGYSSIEGMKKSVDSLQEYVDSADGQAIVTQFGNYHGSSSVCCNPSSTEIRWENGWLVEGSVDGLTIEDANKMNDLKEPVNPMGSYTTEGGKPNKILLHSTEGTTNGFAAYFDNKYPAHFVIDPRERKVSQEFSIYQPSLAIVGHDKSGPIQIEIVGFSTPRSEGYSQEADLNNFSNEDWDYLAKILKAISEETGIPLTSSVSWTEGTERLGDQEFIDYKGVLGHMHVPGNDHTDPGDIWKYVSEAIDRQGGSNSNYCSTGGNGDINATAIELAWPETGHGPFNPTPAYAKALQEVGFTSCDDQCVMTGTSCDVFVTTVMKYSGVDKDFDCCMVDTVESYMKSHPEKYQEVENKLGVLQPGDIRISDGHVELYVEINGQPHIASASNCDRTGEIIDYYDSSAFRAYRFKK